MNTLDTRTRLTTDAILIVDDDEDILTAGKLLLKRHFSQVDTCANPGDIPEKMRATDYAAILLDMNFGPGASSGEEGLFWLDNILQLDPDAVVVLITAHGGVDTAVEAMKLGATDFISKPWQNEKLVATLSAGAKLRQSRSEATQLKQANTALIEAASQPLLGESQAMQRVIQLIERTAPTEANVLLLGENGTGKELAARAIHQASDRRGEVFITVDVGAIPESLFESEIFGHVKGAFTDAKEDKVGRLQAAAGGTLFLDEIGNLPLHLQPKLLSVLEQRKVQPLGSNKLIDIDVRVIAATNMPRTQLTSEDVFRQDLLFRLNTVEIELPPLRDRKDDIATIAKYYIDYYSTKYKRPIKELSEDALDAMLAYNWPGNIRALRHAIERAVILATSDRLDAADLALMASPPVAAAQQPSEVPVDGDLNLQRLEKAAIQEALTRHRYNISHAAKELGLTRAALYRRMEKHGL